MKLLRISAISLSLIVFANTSFPQETQKPFITEHILHKHAIDIVNTTVYQQVENYGALYNTTHLFGTFDFTESDEIFINASITFGNGITYKTERKGYTLTTTGDDLEDYLKNINETGREYLLEAYYQKNFGRLTVTGGLIDSTAFIDTNKYANDEHTQFLNSAFINNPIAVLPSYNWGIYIHYGASKNLSFSTIYMQNKPDKGNVGILEIKYETQNLSLRPYYFYLFGTEENRGLGISGDYTFNEKVGFFFRYGISNVDYDYFFSSGFQINSVVLNDHIGFGYGFLKGKPGIENITLGEIYYTIDMNKHVALTMDLQYMKEKNSDFIFGSRLFLYY